ncbi:DUF2380 domain-containing protein [Pyxidicoccus sp. MSG2]|uniref:DUF2380 domain-containing protein n=1 Tax=Pyxidicoccus sp. MSG2 TaxID=2996790 RepID=UPI002270F2C5|nr:DUF2380 domain-containing protein [Pyxidicoccus sp. MSG2]MCY1018926.1 DUF2380 domain-containing protein [Pyxidicoccus sp. MSG2]
MRAEALLLSVAVLTTSCASLPAAPGRREGLSYQPRGAGEPERLNRLQGSGEVVTGMASGGVSSGQSATLTRQAVVDAVDEVRDSTSGSANALAKLAARKAGIGGANGVFIRYVAYGSSQLPWLRGALGGATTLVDAAEEVADADMELGLLGMTGPRLQAAMFGDMLLAAWLDFLNLADVVLQQCPAYSAERLLKDMDRVQRMMEPTLAALASQDPERVETAAATMPGLMGQLAREFGSIREGARTAMERSGQAMAAAQFVEMLTLVSTLKLSLPRLPPAAPATVGVGLVMGSGGVMAGSRLVVSAEWVEMIRRLVKAGVISVPVVSAAVRIHAGQVMMAQSNGDLPRGVRDALGDGPEVRGMRETGRAGAGMSENPLHHVLPRERRAWFEQRGFTGDMDIDHFCVRLEQAHHEAIHGGGDWRLGRMWPKEWNRMIMKELLDAEARAGRRLSRSEILRLVARSMRNYKIPMNFASGRRR